MSDTVMTSNSRITTDALLVELAGLHAYRSLEIDDWFNVSGSTFEVIDTNYEHPTGLDALTVQNLETGEYIIVYVGTQVHSKYGHEDIKTNIQLLNKNTPAQLEAANAYFEKMEAKLAKEGKEISAVCGNSLGGAKSNYVGVKNPHVRSVTLNPAPLPYGVLDTNEEYANITNYISTYDILNLPLTRWRIRWLCSGQAV